MTERLLHHERVFEADRPAAWMYVLPGIFGTGRNWKTVARKLVAARPDWGAVLVDLREHGGSRGFEPPHTLAAAAADLGRLAAATGGSGRAVLGHSFGGKVALRWVADQPEGLAQAWIIDSTPDAGEPGGSAWQMLGSLRRLPNRFSSRDEAVSALMALGVARPVAQWMGTNLERHPDGVRWRFDLDALQALLTDFFRTDLWAVVEAPPAGVDLHFVKAGSSSVLGEGAVARLERARGQGVHIHRLDGGHWLNADNPEGVVDLLARFLPPGG